MPPISWVPPSSPLDGDTLPPGHRGSLVHLQAISSSTPKFLPGTDGGWSLQVAAPRGLTVCATLTNTDGWQSVASGERADH